MVTVKGLHTNTWLFIYTDISSYTFCCDVNERIHFANLVSSGLHLYASFELTSSYVQNYDLTSNRKYVVFRCDNFDLIRQNQGLMEMEELKISALMLYSCLLLRPSRGAEYCD